MIVYNYAVCGLFFILFVALLTVVGSQILRGTGFSQSLVLGYIAYSFPIAVAGIIIQFLNLPWILFASFLGIEWIVLILLSVFLYKKGGRAAIYKDGFRDFIKNNWVVFLTAILMAAVMLLYYRGFWLGNHQDDGYYITKIATLPFTQTGGNYNYALGVENVGFNSYLFNTWEIEASVYVRILRVDVTLFLRLFQSAFYYFLWANLLNAFSQKIVESSGIQIKKNLAQYPAFVVLFFNIYYLALSHTNLLNIQDMFHTNTGMFLGFTVIRTMGILMLLLFFIDREKIDVKMIVGVAVISTVLMSKSTVALPLIIITAVSSLVLWLFTSYGKKGRILACIMCGGIIGAGIVIPGTENIQSIVYTNFKNILYSPIVWICMIIFLLSFTLRAAIIYKLNGIICCMALFMLIPGVNDVFEKLSVYGFVGARTVTALISFFIMVNSVYFCMLLSKVHIKEAAIKAIYVVVGAGVFGICLLSFKLYGGEVLTGQPPAGAGIRQSLGTLKNNKYFMPNSTIELGGKLDSLSEKSEDPIKVVTPTMVILDGTFHPLPVFLRIYAHDIIPVSAALRYPANDGSVLSEYKQQYYDSFISEPSDESYALFKEEIQNLDINCIVVYDEECSPWLKADGFKLYDTVGDNLYYIWYKE